MKETIKAWYKVVLNKLGIMHIDDIHTVIMLKEMQMTNEICNMELRLTAFMTTNRIEQMRTNGLILDGHLELKEDLGKYLNGGKEMQKEIKGKYK